MTMIRRGSAMPLVAALAFTVTIPSAGTQTVTSADVSGTTAYLLSAWGTSPLPAPAPTITAVNPNPIPGTKGFHAVTITGTNFVDKPTVIATWGAARGGSGRVNASRVKFVSSTRLTVMVRVAIAPDTGSFRVVNSDGQTSNVYAFSINTPPRKITAVNPNPVPGTLGVPIACHVDRPRTTAAAIGDQNSLCSV